MGDVYDEDSPFAGRGKLDKAPGGDNPFAGKVPGGDKLKHPVSEVASASRSKIDGSWHPKLIRPSDVLMSLTINERVCPQLERKLGLNFLFFGRIPMWKAEKHVFKCSGEKYYYLGAREYTTTLKNHLEKTKYSAIIYRGRDTFASQDRGWFRRGQAVWSEVYRQDPSDLTEKDFWNHFLFRSYSLRE